MDKIHKLELCKGRHEIPDAVDGSVFDFEINPLKPDELEKQAIERLQELNVRHLELYVTGLSVALVAVINATKELKIDLVLYHYNKDDNTYFAQKVK